MRNPYLSKIQPPSIPPYVLHRAPLVETLHDSLVNASAAYKLLLLCAPAGYGKTTLLADFANHTDMPCCWYFLDGLDNDVCAFAQTLLASIRYRFPHLKPDLDEQLVESLSTLTSVNASSNALKTFVDHLIAAIETDISERFAIFLCNYQEVNDNQLIQDVVNQFVRYLPRHCVLVIESRAIPILKLTSLMAQGQLLGIGSGRLGFTTEEIRALSRLYRTEPFSEEEAAYLASTFEGWIVGVLLSTRLGNPQALSFVLSETGTQQVSVLGKDREILLSYLVDEVFKNEPEAYLFLKEVSLLQQVTPELCNRLLDITDGEARLKDLEQRGLFVTRRGDESQRTYACPPALREVLYAEACRQNAERMTTLHRRAIAIFDAEKDFYQAIAHALAIHADDQASVIILTISKQLLQQGYAETLANWLDALKPETLERHPQLLLTRANIHLQRYEYAQAHVLLERAHSLFQQQSLPMEQDLAPTLLAEILIAKSSALFRLGNYAEVQQLCLQALEQLPLDEKELCALAYQRLGICACLLGDPQTGIAQLHRALQLRGGHAGKSQLADIHSSLANVYSMQGNFALAEHHRQRAIVLCEQTGDVRGRINNMVWQAILQRDKGLYADAERMFREIIAMAQNEGYTSGQAYATFSLGETYLDQDRFEEALLMTEDALALARKIDDNYLINQALCSLALEYLFMGDVASVSLFLDHVTVKTPSTAGYEAALREQTRGTVLLWQGNYQEAYRCLKAVEQPLRDAGFTRLGIQTIIRIAVCQSALGYARDAEQTMERAVALVQRCHYEHLALIELRRFPTFWKGVQTMSERSCLSVWRTHQPQTVVNSSEPVAEQVPMSTPQLSVVTSATGESEPLLKIQAFGEPNVVLRGELITHWRMARSIELCFFLMDYKRPIRKEQILTALWEEVDENTDQTLRSAIHYLRKAIGASCIVYEAGMYTFNLAALYGDRIEYDVDLFLQNYVHGHSALKEERIPQARSHFQSMVDLYRGDYVQSFYGRWCTARRDELRQYYLDARRELGRIAWDSEQFEESALHWQHMLTIDNCFEEAHYYLMRCYLRMGKRGLALRQYQRCLETLQAELGVSPGPSIQRVYQKLTTGTL